MKTWYVATLFVPEICSMAWAQDTRGDLPSGQPSNATNTDLHLRPLLHGGMALGGDRYTIPRGEGGAGFDLVTKGHMTRIDGRFQNARWGSSNKGSIVSADAFAARRIRSNWYLGFGIEWSSVETDVKRCKGLRPMVVVVRDVVKSLSSMQIQGKYFLPSLDGSKDRPGGEIGFYVSSPSSAYRLIFGMEEGINRFPALPGVPATKTF